ncbi:ADP-heptose--lipooligosaccharide heptosyltransferase II [hydrothermal vent metagenome]|uniref:ADP-heptose--lipooligosaccharide heptosyltransferase II n=1 Tax=hydrothermal vent metagenome TaxID=652676 RepID=A0A3B0UIR1_9ZZZZ
MKVKFLIIRFSSIGDIVLTSPVIRCLKEQVTGAEIYFVVKEKYAEILKANPHIKRVFLYKDKITPLLKELEKVQFDYIIDLHMNIRSNRIKRWLKIPGFSFDKLNFKKWLLVNFKVDRLPKKHIVDRYLETVKVFDVKNDEKGLDYFIPGNQHFDYKSLPEVFQNGYIAFCIAGSYQTKKLPPEKIIAICRKLPYPIVLLGGNREKPVGDSIAGLFSESVVNLCDKISLNESALLVGNARLVLTNDTGMMHIAAAFRKKILSFWGNTVPGLGMYPYLPDPVSKIMQVDGLKCRPCSKLGFDKCPKKHFRCMNDIDVEEVAGWVHENFR